MLAASLQFLFVELGISDIYYHHYESGCQLKSISCGKPPRSIYTDLPKKFCFGKTEQTPEFLLQDKKFSKRLKQLSRHNIQWQKLELEKNHAWA